MARQVVGARRDHRRSRGNAGDRSDKAGRGGVSAPRSDGGAVRSRRLIVLGVLGVLCTVTLAPHVRLYVEQEQQHAQVRADIAAREAAVADLQRQSDLWRDDAFIAAQARERLHYVFPGETSYVVAPELLAAGAAGPAGVAVPGGRAVAPAAGGTAVGAVQPWYRELWDGFAAAGEPVSSEAVSVEPAGGPAG